MQKIIIKFKMKAEENYNELEWPNEYLEQILIELEKNLNKY